jgi:hypothetical protein
MFTAFPADFGLGFIVAAQVGPSRLPSHLSLAVADGVTVGDVVGSVRIRTYVARLCGIRSHGSGARSWRDAGAWIPRVWRRWTGGGEAS